MQQYGKQAGLAPASHHCTVNLFGGLSLRLPGQAAITRFRTQKTAALLAYLAFHRDRLHAREVLIDMLWPDANSIQAGRLSLSVALSSLRAQMEPPGVPPGSVIISDRTHVGLNPEAVTTDVHQFESLLDRADAPSVTADEAAVLRTRAVALYEPKLIPGHYENWISAQEARLTDRYAAATQALTAYFEQVGQPGQALEYARAAAQADPLSEEAGRELIRLLIACDQGEAAINHLRQMEATFESVAGESLSEATYRLIAPVLEAYAAPAAGGATAAARPQRIVVPPARTPGAAPAGEAISSVAVMAVASPPPAEETAAAVATPLALAPAVAPHPMEAPLPPQRTRFYGREEELSRLRRTLSDPSVRLLSITGPGGVGKTRFSLAFLADLRERRDRQRAQRDGGGTDRGDSGEEWIEDVPALMRDFVGPEQPEDESLDRTTFYVPLAHVPDAGLLPTALQEAVAAAGVRTPGGATAPRDPLESVVRALSVVPRPLLVLDNFEHMSEEGADTVDALLDRVPDLTCVVTTRQKLLLEGEHEFPLGALPTLPPPTAGDDWIASAAEGGEEGTLDPESVLRRSPAVAMFVDRAQMAVADFQITPRNAMAITELVARLEGIPLAIELAAARAQVLTPHQILAQFDRRFELLVSKARSRGTLDRHRSLRATLAWSYDLLPEESLKKLFARLSVFRGGFTMEAAQAVAVDASRDPQLRRVYLMDALAQLCDASLIRSEESVDANGEPCLRFTMLETLRAFGEECLEADEQEMLRGAHARYFLEAAEEAEARCRQDAAAEPTQLARLDADRGNLRAALQETARAGGKAEDDLNLVRFANALYRYWRGRGYLREGSEWFAVALARRERLRVLEVDGNLSRNARQMLEARLVNNAAILATERGELERAEALLEECRALFERSGDVRGESAALNNLAIIASRRADWDTAIRRYALCLKRFRACGDEAAWGNALSNLGMVYSLQGRYKQARGVLTRSLESARQRGDRRIEATLLHILGVAELKSGNVAVADARFRESLRIASELSDVRGMSITLYSLGILADDQGDARRADRLLAAALGYLGSQGISLPLAWRQDLERVRPELGDLSDADPNHLARTLVERLASSGEVASAGHVLSITEAAAYALSGFATAPIRPSSSQR